MTDPFLIAQGAQRPSVSFTFTADDEPVDLTGTSSVVFYLRPADSDTFVLSGATAAVHDATGGVVRYDWGASDTATSGEYAASFRVNSAAGPLISPEFPVTVFARADEGAAARKVRALLDDQAADLFTPGAVADALAETGRLLIDARIEPYGQRVGGTVAWYVYDTGLAWVDPAIVVRDAAGTLIASGYGVDEASGRVTFVADQRGSARWVTGTVYDPHLAAAALADQLAARYAREYDFESDGATFNRSQRAAQWARLADQLRSQAQRVETAEVVRLDAQPGAWWERRARC